MLDISNEIKQKYKSDNINYKLKVVIDGIEYNYNNVLQGSLKITESLCSKDDLDFSSVEKNVLNISLLNFSGNINSIYNKQIQIFHVMENPAIGISLGKFTIRNVEFESDYVVNITAYDFTDLLDIDVSDWWNNLVQYPISAKNLLLSLANFCHVQVDLPSTYCNHDFMINKNILVENTKGVEFLGYLQELSGCFFKFDRDGILKRISLNNTSSIEHIYPGINTFPSNSLYTDNASDITINENYDYTKIVSDVILADYNVSKIEKVQVKGSKNDIGVIVGTGSNTYEIQSNPLMYGLIDNQLRMYVENILNEIKNIVYKPFQAKVRTMPYLEVGDWIQLTTYKNKIAKAPIFKRIISGPSQYLDEISCKGKFNRKEIKSINKTINVLNQKMLEVVANVEQFSTTMTDKYLGLESEIKQTANEINLQLENKLPPNNLPNNDFYDDTYLSWNNQIKEEFTLNGIEYKCFEIYKTSMDNESVTAIKVNYNEISKYIRAGGTKVSFYTHIANFYMPGFVAGKTYQFNTKYKVEKNSDVLINELRFLVVNVNNSSGSNSTNELQQNNQWNSTGFVKTIETNVDSSFVEKQARLIFQIYIPEENPDNLLNKPNDVIYFKQPYIFEINSPTNALPFEIYNNKMPEDNVITQINMMPDSIRIRSEKVNIDGLVTINDLKGSGSTIINGDNIKTGTIKGQVIEAPILKNITSINDVTIDATGDITVINWDGQLVRLRYNNGIVTGWMHDSGDPQYGAGINGSFSAADVSYFSFKGGILRKVSFKNGEVWGTD